MPKAREEQSTLTGVIQGAWWRRGCALAAVASVLAAGPAGCRKSRAPAEEQAPAAAAPDLGQFARSYLDRMTETVESDPAMEAINAAETLYSEINRDALKPWREGWKAGRAESLVSVLVEGATVPAFAATKPEPVRERDGLLEFSWAPPASGEAAAQAQGYLADAARVEDFRLDVLDVLPTDAGARLEVRLDLRAHLADGRRRHDRGMLNVEARRVEGSWKLASVQAASLERVETAAGRGPAFEHATAAVKLDKVPVTERLEAIRRGGYALAVADYDNDDRPDMLLGHYGRMQLLRNTAGGYVDVTAKVGIQEESLVKAAAFADLDNDGYKDLVLLRFVVSKESSVGDFVAYRNKGDGTFERKGDVLPRSVNYDRAMPLTLADFDGNGTLDLYLGFPGARDFTENLEAAERPAKLRSQGVWFNDGEWNFREATGDEVVVAANQVYPHAVVATDLDQDGRPDLLVVDDSGRINPVYRNVGEGRFEEITAKAGLDAPGWSMGANTGDFDGDGLVDVLTTHVAMHSVERVLRTAERVGARAELVEFLRGRYVGAQLYRNKGDGTFEEISEQAGLTWVGEGAGSADWIDYNNDGLLDVYVPNGLWSGGGEELDSLFARASVAKPDTYTMNNDVHRGSVLRAPPREPNALLTVLRNFHGSLGADGEAADKPTLSLAGFQRNRLFRNNGDGTFTEVGFLEGADRIEDGYILSAVDFDGSGRQDLFLRHTDPSPSQRYESVTLLRNVHPSGNSLTVFARGTTANRDGIGAQVTAHVGDRRLVREIQSTTGATQSEPVAFFGLGEAKKVDKLEVRWPGGEVQIYENVSAGRVVVQQDAGTIRLAARAK